MDAERFGDSRIRTVGSDAPVQCRNVPLRLTECSLNRRSAATSPARVHQAALGRRGLASFATANVDACQPLTLLDRSVAT